MNKETKYILLLLGGYMGYRLYSLYKLSNAVEYSPIGFELIRGKSLKDFMVRVKMKLTNPTGTSLEMKGIDGTLSVNNTVISSFTSPAFTINNGDNFFTIDFKLEPSNVSEIIVNQLASNSKPLLIVTLRKHLSWLTTTERFALNPNK